jgi:tetratricopeptide (TPR) repeat protein
MLETVRAFGAERLAAAGETDRFRAAHAAYFLDLAWTADPHLRRAEQVEWLDRLDAERDNFHAGLRSALALGDVGTAMELVTALSGYWRLRGLRTEAAAFAGKVLDRGGPEPPPGREEEYAVCVLTAAMGGTADPSRLPPMDTPAWILRYLDRPPRQPVIFVLSALTGGPPDDGSPEHAAAIAEQQRLLDIDPWSLALTPLGLGYILLWSGRFAEAEPAFAEALAGYRALGERWGMTNASPPWPRWPNAVATAPGRSP